MVVARRMVMRWLDRRRRYRTRAGTSERTERKKPSQRCQAKHQRRLPSREIGGAFGQLFDRLILQPICIMVDVVCKSPDKTGEHVFKEEHAPNRDFAFYSSPLRNCTNDGLKRGNERRYVTLCPFNYWRLSDDCAFA